MEIVATHDMSDFDGFASCVAAQRLYPGAVVVLGARLSPALRDFLALHKDRFPSIGQTDLDQGAVTRLVAVDVRRRERLEAFDEVLARVDRGEAEIHVWDHHGASNDDVVASVEHVERVGSATTLLVEEMRRRGMEPDRVEATLYLIGIYSDTGALTYAMTTPRDARAVAWLLERGASLTMLNRYLDPPFTAEQRAVLGTLLGCIETERVAGVEIGMAVVHLDEMVDGLADITSQAIDLRGVPALFAIFVIGDKRIQIVARARRPWIDVGKVVEAVGGGGHAPAAAAILKHADWRGVRESIVAALRRNPPRPMRVADLMSSPVHTVPHDMPMGVLRDSLASWEHTGVPVMKNGRMVGIVSRRDVDEAAAQGKLSVPVSGHMSHRVRTTEPDRPIEDALATMVEHDVGRLPVVRRGRLVGIVTRSDLLRVLYPDGPEGRPTPPAPRGRTPSPPSGHRG